MSEELLSLKWNNHQSHFVDILTFLREQEIFIDATLACGGKLYPAHKFVLSTCSDYFKQMFTKNPSKHPIVFMKDVSCRDLEALLDFMYNGEVNVPQSSLGSLIKTAEGLQIKGLAVPDDPPIPSKRESALLRDRRELKASRDNSYSPSPKRLRGKDKSPTPFSGSRSKSPPPLPVHVGTAPSAALGSVGVDNNNAIDEDSRTSALSDSAIKTNSTSNSNNNSHLNNEDIDTLSRVLNREPSPGPSGLHKNTPQHSKEEELDIKQEDVVDLGDHEEGDWGGGGDGDGRGDESLDDGGGGDSLTSENNTPNFSDVLGPATDGSLNTSGDPAMSGRLSIEAVPSPPLPASSFVAPTSSSSSLSTPFLRTKRLPIDLVAEGVSFSSSSNCGNKMLDLRYKEDYCRELFDASLNHLSVRGLSSLFDRPFKCPYCSMSFKRKYTLQEHVRIHLGQRPYSCSTCGKSFTQSSSLGKHLKRIDGGGAVMVTTSQLLSDPAATTASIVGDGIESQEYSTIQLSLRGTQHRANMPSSSIIATSTMPVTNTPSSSSGTSPIDVVPSVYRLLLETSSGGSGSICSSNSHPSRTTGQLLKFSSPSPSSSTVTITNHPVSCEDGDQHHRPFPCKFCEARFKKKQHLQNHERIHTGEKYVCYLCGQGFSRLHILKHHVNRKHVSDGITSPSSSMIQHN